MRFDPVWRRIKPDSYTTKLEGQFRDRLIRLDGLNNWGSLGWLYDHANASKQAHHFGLEWNAIRYLDGDVERGKYRAGFRTAAHVAHWGHLPRSYAGEEAVLRAAHVDAAIQGTIEKVLDDVIAFGSLRCDERGHSCAGAIRTGDRPFELYRWLSAYLVSKNWSKIWKAVKAAAEIVPDQATLKAELIETLVCTESRGYKILRRCNQADYVPRDLLQAGTAWLTFDIDALWEGNPLGADAAREWSLIDAAQSYLNDRFFHGSDALLVQSLVSRAIAGGLLADGLSPKALVELTSETDEYFGTKLKPYHRTRLDDVRAQISSGIGTRWAHVGTFTDVSLADGSRLDMEDQLSGVTGRNRVSYPFSLGFNIIAEPGSDRFADAFQYAGAGRRFASVHLHHERKRSASPPSARPILDVVATIAERTVPGPQLGNNIMSWLLEGQVQQRSSAFDRVCGQLASDQAADLRTAVSELLALKSLEEVVRLPTVGGLLSALADPGLSLGQRPTLAGVLLRLSWPCYRYAPGRKILTLLHDAALLKAASGSGAQRGYALEVAVATNQLLDETSPQSRFVFLGSTLIGKDGQPAQEWDVVRLDLDGNKGWSVTAIECAVARAAAKDEEARTKLELMRTHLASRFSDLTSFRTLLATVDGGALNYEDAGRSWTKV
jgi:hypothetical protein